MTSKLGYGFMRSYDKNIDFNLNIGNTETNAMEHSIYFIFINDRANVSSHAKKNYNE